MDKAPVEDPKFPPSPPSDVGSCAFTLQVPEEMLGTPVEAEVSMFVPPRDAAKWAATDQVPEEMLGTPVEAWVSSPVPPWAAATAVPFHVPVVIVPTDTKFVAVVKPDKVVKVAFEVAAKVAATLPGPEAVTSPVSAVM
jgi:hypothetical protein